VTIDGVTFHAETFGSPENPTVVVVHGGPGGDYGYLLNLHVLADDYFVVFYDQRGAGLSPRVPAEELTLQSSVADLHRIVTHFGGGAPVRLIGHSWGGMLTAAYIGQHPEFVSHAVLAEPGALDNAGLARFNERQAASARSGAYYLALVPTIFESLHLNGPDGDAQNDYIFGKMSAEFAGTAASGYVCADGSVAAMAPTVPVPASRFGTTAFQTLFGPEADLSPIAANADNYTRPLLFIASECNSFIGAEFQQEQMALFPQAELVVIPDAGHEMFGENPAASLAAVRAFFK
jgi:proline iminopeptidase